MDINQLVEKADELYHRGIDIVEALTQAGVPQNEWDNVTVVGEFVTERPVGFTVPVSVMIDDRLEYDPKK